jgi:hypothetical protein
MNIVKLRETFPHRLISRFSDLNGHQDFFISQPPTFVSVWGCLNSRVLQPQVATLDELKADIREAIRDVLKRVKDDFTESVLECSTAEATPGPLTAFLK